MDSLKTLIKSANIKPKEEFKEGQYGFMHDPARSATNLDQFNHILKERLQTAPVFTFSFDNFRYQYRILLWTHKKNYRLVLHKITLDTEDEQEKDKVRFAEK